MEYKFIEALPPLLYDTFVKKHKHCHLLQSAGWGEVKSNWTPYLTALENEEGDIVAAGLVLARSFPLGQSMLPAHSVSSMGMFSSCSMPDEIPSGAVFRLRTASTLCRCKRHLSAA